MAVGAGRAGPGAAGCVLHASFTSSDRIVCIGGRWWATVKPGQDIAALEGRMGGIARVNGSEGMLLVVGCVLSSQELERCERLIFMASLIGYIPIGSVLDSEKCV